MHDKIKDKIREEEEIDERLATRLEFDGCQNCRRCRHRGDRGRHHPVRRTFVWLMHQALEQFEQSTRQAVENFEQTNRLAAERGRAEQAARDCKLREQEATVRAELAAQQHVEQTRRQAVLDEASTREATWAKF